MFYKDTKTIRQAEENYMYYTKTYKAGISSTKLRIYSTSIYAQLGKRNLRGTTGRNPCNKDICLGIGVK